MGSALETNGIGASFDIEIVRTTLHGWLIGSGLAPTNSSPMTAATQHCALHGVGLGPHCPEAPCRAAGVAFGLLELVLYEDELPNAKIVIALADSVDRKAAILERMIRELTEEVGEFEDQLTTCVHPDHVRLGAHAARPHSLLCERPGVLLDQVRLTADVTREFASQLRTLVYHPELREPPRRGRRRELLLKSIRQNLRAGGFSCREIAELVPDGVPGNLDAREQRVAKCVADADWRYIMPFYSAPECGSGD
jgi:hypothetical protein